MKDRTGVEADFEHPFQPGYFIRKYPKAIVTITY